MSNLFEIIKSIIFGIVEGITEWLPISSTGHMILLEKIMPLKVSDAFFSMFLVVIQLGAIIAVLVTFWYKIWPFRIKKQSNGQKGLVVRRKIISLWGKVIVATIPAAVLGLLFDDLLDKYLYTPIVVSITLIIYGIAFIIVERINKTRLPKVTKINELPYSTAMAIGFFQVLSLIPGTSRSGATILGGILFGASRKVASEFTFFLAIPVMFGASLYKILKYVALGSSITSIEILVLIDGLITAFAVSLLAIRFLMNYIKKHDFKLFGYYRIVLGIIVIFAFATGFFK